MVPPLIPPCPILFQVSGRREQISGLHIYRENQQVNTFFNLGSSSFSINSLSPRERVRVRADSSEDGGWLYL